MLARDVLAEVENRLLNEKTQGARIDKSEQIIKEASAIWTHGKSSVNFGRGLEKDLENQSMLFHAKHGRKANEMERLCIKDVVSEVSKQSKEKDAALFARQVQQNLNGKNIDMLSVEKHAEEFSLAQKTLEKSVKSSQIQLEK